MLQTHSPSFVDQPPKQPTFPDHVPPNMPALTAAERVLVRDGWNKFLVHKDKLMELFVARLLHEKPDVRQHLGPTVNDLPLNMLAVLAQAVDQLTPPVPKCPYPHHQTPSPKPTLDLASLLEAIPLQPQHWLAARRVWLWTVTQIPQLEPYDRENLARGSDSAMARFFSLYVVQPALNAGQQRTGELSDQPLTADSQQRLLHSAWTFIHQVAQELNWSEAECSQRWRDVEVEINQTGTYTHTTDELTYGAILSWRNASKCIGRVAWRTLTVRDRRHVTNPDAMFQECVAHLRAATNGGAIQSVMTIFRAKQPLEQWGPRIWNGQYIQFAAYRHPDGTVLGDPANLALTDALRQQGWIPPTSPTAFDVLPLAIDVPGHAVKLHEFDPADILRVRIEHPNYPAVNALNLQWCAVPAIANFRLDIGGVQYSCAPFNGWFMETEIARDLWEPDRYNQAEAIAHSVGLSTSKLSTLWRDRAFLELNVAVLHSFTKAKVTIIDHQTAARQFMTHDLREKKAGRECPAQWSWVVPAAGGSTTPVWHHEMRDFELNPSLHYAADRWVVINE